ncbi:GIY-YIG nuclease family protein [Curvibacter sp. APW13]|uniref:GIY-YIG nuclease family protein n=1 Tax=Curvibacter sp. APW13 TaxID=3077236 RepID=UPI0028DFBEBD|nr:GIY-YIG nuclease family protein [Curvibacter sp. APW13]MDT8989962.1 GIY-YIG nuclease family protein [Curvibacter sp. APW13]
MEQQKAYLYLLLDAKEPVFKIGRAIDLWVRERQLPDDFDLENSWCVQLRNVRLAKRLEKLLHALYEKANTPRAHGGDGYTEWFDVSVLEDVKSFLEKNRDVLQCSGIESFPVRPNRALYETKTSDARVSSAEVHSDNLVQKEALLANLRKEVADRFNSWISGALQRERVVGWLENILVLHGKSEVDVGYEELKDIRMLAVRSCPQHFIPTMQSSNDFYFLEFAEEPSCLVDAFVHHGVPFNQQTRDLLLSIPEIPDSWHEDIDVLTKYTVIELILADKLEAKKLSKMTSIAADRLLARVADANAGLVLSRTAFCSFPSAETSGSSTP